MMACVSAVHDYPFHWILETPNYLSQDRMSTTPRSVSQPSTVTNNYYYYVGTYIISNYNAVYH